MHRPGRHCALLFAFCLMTCGCLAAADESFAVDNWKVQSKPGTDDAAARTFASFQLRNTTDTAIANLTVTLELRTAAGTTSSERKTIESAASGAPQDLQLAVAAADDAAEYRLLLQFPQAGRTRTLILGGGTADLAPHAVAPKPEPAQEAGTAALKLGRWKAERVKDSKNVNLTGTLTNNGTAAVTNLKLTIKLTHTAGKDQPARVVYTEILTIAGTLDAGATRTVEKIIADCPDFDGLNLELPESDAPVARSPGLGEPKPDSKGDWEEGITGATDVEIGLRDIRVNAKGEIEVRGKIRNGFGAAVMLESIEWEFTTPNGTVKKLQTELRGKLPPKTLSALDLDLQGIGRFTRYSYVVNYRN